MKKESVATTLSLCLILISTGFMAGNSGTTVFATSPEEYENHLAVEAWAVLLCGGVVNETMCQPGFENQVAEAYNTLIHRGYSKDHIYLIDFTYPRDVDSDGINDVNADSRKPNVEFAFTQWLKQNSDYNDMVFIYMTGHGYGLEWYQTINGTHPFVCWAEGSYGELLFPWELESWLDLVQCGKMVLTIDACWAGVFIPYLSQENRVIITATTDNKSAFGEFRFIWSENGTFAEPYFTNMWLPVPEDSIWFEMLDYNMFSHTFFNTLEEKRSLAEAFNASVLHIFWQVGGGSDLVLFGDPPPPRNPVWGGNWTLYLGDPEDWSQYPWLDDNGDGVGTGGPMPTMTDGNHAAIMVWMPGDINEDGKIDIKDTAAVAKAYNTSCSPNWNPDYDLNDDGVVDDTDVGIVCDAYGSYPGHPNWNPDADVNHDGKVDIRDVAIVAKAKGAHCDSLWNPHADLNGNWIIDDYDLNTVCSNFGYGV